MSQWLAKYVAPEKQPLDKKVECRPQEHRRLFIDISRIVDLFTAKGKRVDGAKYQTLTGVRIKLLAPVRDVENILRENLQRWKKWRLGNRRDQ